MNIQIEKLTPKDLAKIYATDKTFIVEKKIQHSEKESCSPYLQDSFLPKLRNFDRNQKPSSPSVGSTDVWDFLEISEVKNE